MLSTHADTGQVKHTCEANKPTSWRLNGMLDQVPVAATADRLIDMQLDSALLNQHSRGRKVEAPKVPARNEDEELRARAFDSHLSTSERLARATGQVIQCSDIQCSDI